MRRVDVAIDIRSLLVLAGCVALVAFVSVTGSVATTPKLAGWYAQLAKPSFTPPNYVFPVAWTMLYFLMALALWRMIEAPASGQRTRAIVLFVMQLAFNAAWSWVFFHFESARGGLAVVMALWLLIAATILAFLNVSRLAAWLLAPYLMWVSFATLLNAEIVRMNP
jgi:translocator protein